MPRGCYFRTKKHREKSSLHWKEFYSILENRKLISTKLKGRKLSNETKRKISSSMLGRKWTVEQKKNLSNIKKGQWMNYDSGYHSNSRHLKLSIAYKSHPHPSKGVVFSAERKEKLRLFSTGRKLSDETKHKISERAKGKIFSEERKDKIRQKTISFLSSGKSKMKDTSIEKKVENTLIEMFPFIKYHKQVSLVSRTVVDFLLPKKVVIYCDGDYWHNLPGRKDSDLRQKIVLEENGYKVYRLTELDINANVLKCLSSIIKKEYPCFCLDANIN